MQRSAGIATIIAEQAVITTTATHGIRAKTTEDHVVAFATFKIIVAAEARMCSTNLTTGDYTIVTQNIVIAGACVNRISTRTCDYIIRAAAAIDTIIAACG